MNPRVKDFTEYIKPFDKPVKDKLKQLQETIQKAAPEAEPVISYNMPAFKYHGVLVYFAGYKNHIGFYPMASGIETFQNEIKAGGYKWAKGSIQFPLDQPLPLTLVTKMIKFRVKHNLEKEEMKKQLKKKK